ncbi:MAG TPA: hypothetical protein PLU39_12960 [Armatimonadota bacterium]|nr:hypothetical protein [Armatimonadota bacterium]HOM80440.1 hypothetical protein [Armatimonadota bacterium]HPO72797.1 hypothetical protein [Armatimonadota bacterium]HPT98770.1 hypothetical protein [Armatimonadota bacterium]
MRLHLSTFVDLLLALWSTLAVAQHVAVVASAAWAVPSSPRLDLAPGYWVVGLALLLCAGASRLSLAKEVPGDR